MNAVTTTNGVAAAVGAVVPLVTTVLVPKTGAVPGLGSSQVQTVQVVQTGQAHTGYYQLGGGGPDSPQSAGSAGSSGTPVKASACPCCFKSFFDRSTMKRHMKRHFADRETYDCVACSKSFTRKDKLRDHLKSARHILTVYGPNALPAGSDRPADAAHSPSSASSPEHPGPSSDALSSLPQTEREIVRFMEKLRTMGKLDGLPIDTAGPLQQLANVSSVFNGNGIGGSNIGVSDTEGDDAEDDAEGENCPETADDRVPESVESPPLSMSPANESS